MRQKRDILMTADKVKPRVLVVNSSFKELNYLAAELSQQGFLWRYVRPYANMDRRWECWLSSVPRLSYVHARTVGRRRLPPGLELADVREAGLMHDFMAALCGRLHAGRLDWGSMIAKALLRRRDRCIAAAAARLADDAHIVLANVTVAYSAFQIARHKGRYTILNYPIAHHRYARPLLEEEAKLIPEFSSTLPSYDWPEAYEARIDAECEVADMILVGSTFVRDSFIAEGFVKNKLLVIPYGADLDVFYPTATKGSDHEGFRVLFVGQISQRKGIAYLLWAYQAFCRSDTRLTLVGNFTGDQSAFDPYRYLFQHIPNVPRTVLASIYREADVFVLPTLVEGMPLVVLEAMASGLPVIVTPNGPCDIVRDGVDGFVVPIRDSDSIAERLEYLRTHKDVCQEMGANARQRALQFTWQVYQRKTLELICGLN